MQRLTVWCRRWGFVGLAILWAWMGTFDDPNSGLFSAGLRFGSSPIVWAAERPHLLWISIEDTSPDLGCYGDRYAVTPTIDRLAAEGVRYTRCFTHAGVCAPSRSGVITGRYPPSIATHNMRCKGVPDAAVKCFSERLRAAGYYCTNASKTDYQFDPPASAWDEISNAADWRGRGAGQPFFAVINLTTTHESQVRDPSPATKRLVAALPMTQRHDPAKAVVPPYYPDTPTVRRDLANLADNISAVDGQIAEILARLQHDELADDTIVFFWGDHGRGITRGKRWLYDSGVHVPLIVRVPEKWRKHAAPENPAAVDPGVVNDSLVAFVDLAPTMLALAHVPIPPDLHGRPFLGPVSAPPREYVHGHRDRMDETYDLIRMVRDRRFKYLRNFRPDLSYGQDINYMNQMPMLKEMRRLHQDGLLTGPPLQYFRATKPLEELFDTEADPHELNNLAGDPQHRPTLLRLRAECERWMRTTGDQGLIPEAELDEWMRPNGQWSVTAPPVVLEQPHENPNLRELKLTSSTPGASLVWAEVHDDGTAGDKLTWKLYGDNPSLPIVAVGKKLAAKAVRIGYRDSPVVRWTVGQSAAIKTARNDGERSTATRSDLQPLIDRLIAFRQQELEPVAGLAALDEAALRDPQAAMRYWALWRMIQRVDADGTAVRKPAPTWLLERRERDPAPIVRVLAAATLARWDDPGPHVAYLADVVQTGTHDSLRLAAITALRDLGPLSHPVRPVIEQAARNGGEYTGRIAQSILEQRPASAR